MEPIREFKGRLAPLPIENVDTDQIIPARFLKVTDKKGLAEGLFCDWRYDALGKPRPDFILNQPHVQGAAFLLAGDNFGCGSSREHAPWALQAFGFKAVISTSFADIFRANSLKNGLLPVIVTPEAHAKLFRAVAEDPKLELVLDLASQALELPDGSRIGFPVDAFSKRCLLTGVDELGYILNQGTAIASFEARVPWRVQTSS